MTNSTFKGSITLSALTMAGLVWLFLADQGNEPAPLDDDDSAGDDDDSGRYDRLPPAPKD